MGVDDDQYLHTHIWFAVKDEGQKREALALIKRLADDLNGNTLTFRMKEYEWDALEEVAAETHASYAEELDDDSNDRDPADTNSSSLANTDD